MPAEADLSFTPLIVFVNDTSGTGSLTLRAPSATLHLFKMSFQEAETGVLTYQHRDGVEHTRLPLRDARIRVVEPADGFIGVYPDAAAKARFQPSVETMLQPQERSDVTTRMSLLRLGATEDEPDRSAKDYHASAHGPHMSWASPGTLRYDGDGALKVYGLDLLVESASLSGTFPTGSERYSTSAVRGGAYRWALIEFANGTMEAVSGMPWRLAASNVEAQAEGRMTMHKIRYASGDSSDAAVARRGTERVEGDIDVTMAAQRSATGLVLARVDVKQGVLAPHGEVALAAQSARTTISGPTAWLMPILGITAILGAGSAMGAYTAVLRHKRESRAMPFRAEDCREAGAAAASEEDWALAAEWFERGVRLAPTSASMNADLAFALSQIGDHDGALRHFAAASRLSNDGEADFNGALAALAAGRPAEEVEAWLARALARSPEFVLHMEEDEEFDPLRRRPQYRRIVEAAWDEVDRRGFRGR